MSVSDILLCIFLGLLIFLVVKLIFALLEDMGELPAILRSGKKKEAKETKETKETKVVNDIDLNDISLDCVVNIDAVESHIDSTLSCLKRELSYCEPDMRRELYKLPFNSHYSYDANATRLHECIDELIKYIKLFDRLNHKF